MTRVLLDQEFVGEPFEIPAGRDVMHALKVIHSDIPSRHLAAEAQSKHAAGERATAPTTELPTPTTNASVRSKQPNPGHFASDIQGTSAQVGSIVPPTPTASSPMPNTQASALADPFLYLLAQVLDDLEKTRIANENRLRQLTRSTEDKDGEERGFGLTEDNPDVARLASIVTSLLALEHGAELNLKRALRRHPLGPWVKNTVGVGEKQGARLLAAVGDPYWNTLYDRPRTVSQLWAYCGLHVLPAGQSASDARMDTAGGDKTGYPDQDLLESHASNVGVAAKRRKGQKANWSATAKMRAYLVATSCIKQATSPYRAVYDARREHTAATHPEWTAAHSHNDGLRVVSKSILKDLWLAAREIHEVA